MRRFVPLLVMAALLPVRAGAQAEPMTFAITTAPEGFPHGHNAGETSIGVDRRTNAALVQLLETTARIRWDDDGHATWEDVTYPPNGQFTEDPILWTDPATNRTFVLHLAGPVSTSAYTDDAGTTWQLTQPPSSAPATDHQTIGGGPYGTPMPTHVSRYPSALYYCAQANLNSASCARSDDGGLTWGVPVPVNRFQCMGLHGHIAVGPDGTAYLPVSECYDEDYLPVQGVFASEDDGLTWQLRVASGIAGPRDYPRDPKVAFDAAGRMYFAASSGGRPLVATSIDGGRTWSAPVDVGAAAGIRNTEFPMVTAGDDGRAAFGFYGTTTDGDDQDPDFDGDWGLYVAWTPDGGASWQTELATPPTDPVQRGRICVAGVFCDAGRNLLDFQDMTLDADGRVLVSFADGCTRTCARPDGTPEQSTDSQASVARQVDGPRLLTQPASPPAGSCTPGENGCLPTAAQCATGAYNGYWDSGQPGKAAACVAVDHRILFYAGGDAAALCGVIIVAEQTVIGYPGRDPNTCP